jgi:hypothetical protein
MQVAAVSTPRYPEWRWRITDYAGAIVEESRMGFPSIAAAVAAGTERMVSMNVIDRSDPAARTWAARPGRRGNAR